MKLTMKLLSIGMLVMLLISACCLDWGNGRSAIELFTDADDMIEAFGDYLGAEKFERTMIDAQFIALMGMSFLPIVLLYFCSLLALISLAITVVGQIIGRLTDSPKCGYGLIFTVLLTGLYQLVLMFVAKEHWSNVGSSLGISVQQDLHLGVGLVLALVMAFGAAFTWSIYLKTQSCAKPQYPPAPWQNHNNPYNR